MAWKKARGIQAVDTPIVRWDTQGRNACLLAYGTNQYNGKFLQIKRRLKKKRTFLKLITTYWLCYILLL